MSEEPFWKIKTLEELSEDEWESLCDGCALCCLYRTEEASTGRIRTIGVSCEYLDVEACRCMVYAFRTEAKPECITLSARKKEEILRMPATCAYRRVAEGRELGWWHPLISRDPGTVHEAGISVRGRVVSGKYVHPDDLP